jgi:nicotinate-nucleotide adenylyltransferase
VNARRQIGLLGGSFDPVHCAHIAIARAAKADFGLGEVWFLPCARSPLKTQTHASDADRLEMLRLALLGESGMRVLPVELDRPPPSYTVDTLRALRTANPDADFTFVAGADSLLSLHEWKDPLELLSLARFATYARPGFPIPAPEDLRLPLPAARRLLADCRTGVPRTIASADIRAAIRSGRSLPPDVLPDAVLRYIQTKGLYR